MKIKNRFKNPNVIPLHVLMYIAWKNLMHKKLRAFLTIFGIVIGIGAIFFLLSFGLGLQELVVDEVLGGQSVKAITVTSPNSKIIKLDQPNFQKMKDLPGVNRVGAAFSFAGSLRAQGSEVDTIVYGPDVHYQNMDNLSLKAGRFLEQADEKRAMINITGLASIGIEKPEDALNKEIEIRIPQVSGNKEFAGKFQIVGVIDTQGGNEVFIPSSVPMAAGANVFSQVKIEAATTDIVVQLRKQVESLGFLTTSPLDTIDQINQVFRFFNLMLVAFGAVGMLVAVLGMFNTLTISLLERTKEIGLMMTLGGRNADMRKLFIIEAGLLSVVGAVIGILLAILLGQVINLVMNAFARGRGVTEFFQLFATPWWLVLGMILFMVAVGLSVVYLPARRAAKINPIDALRRE